MKKVLGIASLERNLARWDVVLFLSTISSNGVHSKELEIDAFTATHQRSFLPVLGRHHRRISFHLL